MEKIDRETEKKGKIKPFLIGKELKTKDLRQTAVGSGKRITQKPESKPPDSLRRGASQAAGAAPTLRYGPAGDSGPRLRLKAAGMTERFPFGPSTRPECPAKPPYWARYSRSLSCLGRMGE